ncbi:prolyl oligopeptidase family serine peptidase [Sphingobium sp. GW456-12-10-14-TSB1]|uniref:prolyl oligopeptidase family serine peptidase n=1 Tax=Sphingobium sp. GW456-12-10-14-TSB1 TaxID=1987165 RepID=UPI00159300A8|nr:prolyl oligopeptidase family serine peptidase [Sphingobium sp. GW456-12-10-14-TSB1]
MIAPAAALALAGAAPAIPAVPSVQRTWTMADILAVPEVKDVVLSADGRFAVYVLRTNNEAEDRPEFALHLLSIGDRTDRILATSPWIDRVRAIPGRSTWSALADFGRGVQLYEIGNDAAVTPVIVNEALALVGSADGAEYGFTETLPLRFGVISYDWSPDGRQLLYATLEAGGKLKPIHGEAVTRLSARLRRAPPSFMHYYVRNERGETSPVVMRPASDRVARFLGALPVWGKDYLDYGVQGDDKGIPSVHRYRWHFATRTTTTLPEDGSGIFWGRVTGPKGGELTVTGASAGRHLVERLPGSDGAVIDYGPTGVILSDPRSPGSWRAANGAFTIAAVRLAEEARYALLRIGRDGKTTLIGTDESLTHCTFRADALEGVCVHEGLARPPRLVRVEALSGRITTLATLSPRHDAITPLRVEKRQWTNRFGYKASGFIVYPREYHKGQRYPAIVVTHDSDADERFAAPDLQWNYPVQLFAERGYVVLLVNEPWGRQSPALEQAWRSLNDCDGRVSPAELQRLIWLNGAETIRSLVEDLARQGLIDRDRLGIAGYSAGSQLVNVTVTQTSLFRAASSGDGAFLEPAAHRYNRCGYRAIYGGPPGDPVAFEQYRALAPSYRAARSSAAMLQQLAEPRAGAIDFHQALEAAHIPAELTLYPGETAASDETHIFHIPSNRRAAMEENLAWFDFWLLDRAREGSPALRERIERWQLMKARWQRQP